MRGKGTASPGGKTGASLVFGPADFVYIGLCAAALIAAAVLFLIDLNLTLSRLSDQPVGTIAYKRRAAQRRFVDRILWDRLRQESPVYSGDYIRTAALSQVRVSLAGGDSIELEENTLIQIAPERDNKFRIDLAEGGLSVDSRAGMVRVKAGETVVETSPGSAALVTATTAGLDLVTLEGSVEMRKGNERRELAAGETYHAAGVFREAAQVAVVSPRPGAKLLNTGEGPLPVAFRWNRSAEDEQILLDIAEDRGFNRIVRTLESRGGGAVAELAKGIYYWRVYPASEAGVETRQGESNGRLTVVYAPAPRLVAPRPEELFRFSTARPGIRFQWTACEGAAAYLVEVADTPGMVNAAYRIQVQATGDETGSVVCSGLGQGAWHWRVTPVYGWDYEGIPVVSDTGSFRIERTADLAAPQLMERQEIVYIEEERDAAYFAWKQEEEAVFYTFLLSQQEDLSRPVVKETVRDNYYAFDIRGEGLKPGQYYWGVYQTDMEGRDSEMSATQTLMVAAAPPERSPQAPVRAAPAPEVPAEAPRETPAPAVPAPAVPAPATAAPVAAPPSRLLAPANLRPAAGHTLTEEIILRDQRIDFSWSPVSGAASYLFAIYQGEREIFRQTAPSASFTLGDLSVLDEGTFTWRIQALPADRNAALPGETAESRFTVELEEIQAATSNQSGVMFGIQ
jgi:hypothetical protein